MKQMKKNIIFILVLSLLFCQGIPAKVQAKGKVPKTKAHAYYMIDAETGKKILSKNAYKRIYPASTVKLLTALFALEHAKEDMTIKYTKKLSRKVPSDAASLNLRTGRIYTVEQYLHMLLIVSDAVSAVVLAEGIAGSQDTFVGWMNKKADDLGMSHSSFDNPIGLDKGNGYYGTYTTAVDYMKISKAAMENDTIREIVAKKKYHVKPVGVNKSFVIKNTNAFYNQYKKMLKGVEYEIIGSKTGTTKAAGYALVATARDDKGREVICAFYGKATHKRLYKDVKKLFDYAYNT